MDTETKEYIRQLVTGHEDLSAYDIAAEVTDTQVAAGVLDESEIEIGFTTYEREAERVMAEVRTDEETATR